MKDSIAFFPCDEQGHPVNEKGNRIFTEHRTPPRELVIPAGKKYCVQCGQIKDMGVFLSRTGRIYAYCQPCRNTASRGRYTTEKGRGQNLRRMYGLLKEEYELMFFRQAGLCACCGKPETVINPHTKTVQRLCVDHNHSTGDVRELLCDACNKLVGQLEADRARVKKATAYLSKHDR